MNKRNLWVRGITGAPHGDVLGWIKPLFCKSCNCIFSSRNSVRANQYGGIELGVVPGSNSIENSTSLLSDKPYKSSRKTSKNSDTIRGRAPRVIIPSSKIKLAKIQLIDSRLHRSLNDGYKGLLFSLRNENYSLYEAHT